MVVRRDDDGSAVYEVDSGDSNTITPSTAGRSRTATGVRGTAQASERRKRLVIAVGMLGGLVALALTYAVLSAVFRSRSDQSIDLPRAGSTKTALEAPEGAGPSGSGVATPQGPTRSAGITEPKISVAAKSRGAGDEQGRVKSATLLGVAVDAIGQRANRATALLEVSIGKDPTGTTRTGTAFCVATSGLFVTHADVVNGVTEAKGQVRMLFGEGLEARTVVYPRIVRVDNETNLASLQIDPDPKRPLEALAPAKSSAVTPGSTVIVFGFPRGKHIVDYDAKGNVVDGPPFDFGYGPPWNKEPPDHRIDAMVVRNVWNAGGRAGAFDFVEGGIDNFPASNLSSGSPALNAAGEVVGIVTRPDAPSTIKIGVGAQHREYTPRYAVDAVVGFNGALSVEHLSRLPRTCTPASQRGGRRAADRQL